jgi:DNA-binding CsgD family transcriptional regulator/tetratricopeptide (TPR) repeat protein/GTPase SAR1 family protein
MGDELLERESSLDVLASLLNEARAGTGRTALVSGEAGVGKTALVERFVQTQSLRTLWGSCEALLTPSPLGPLHDIAYQLRGRLVELIEAGAPRQSLFSTFLDSLRANPTIVVFEDVHWADDATLDLMKFLARRISQVPTLLVLTYRDDEVGPTHPLTLTLGDLAAAAVRHVSLAAFSERAVDELARRAGRASAGLFDATGGNPFFVTEILASDGVAVPRTVRDAVLARIARLTSDARGLLEFASVVPPHVEQWVVDQVLDAPHRAIGECLEHGVLRLENDALAFRHELARRAVEEALSPFKRKAHHKSILDVLAARGGDRVPLSRLVHHGVQAGDAAAVLRFAPAAAKQAAALSAHRVAAAHYATALSFAADATDEQRADWMEGRAYECWLTHQLDAALSAREQALAIRRSLHQAVKIGHNLRWLSRQHWYAGHKQETDRYAQEAVAVLEALPPGPELAMAYGNKSQLHQLVGETDAAVTWGNRAIELAERLGEIEVLVHALNSVGTAQCQSGDQGGLHKLARSLQLALTHGLGEHAVRAYNNLGDQTTAIRDYVQAVRYLDEGVAFCSQHDIDLAHILLVNRAAVSFALGKWQETEAIANGLAVPEQLAAMARATKIALLGHLRVRRGDPGAEALLAEARELAMPTGEISRIWQVVRACAEAAWLAGDLARCTAQARFARDEGITPRGPWELGELAFWLWRGGQLQSCPQGIARPYALQIGGDWRAAAAEWERIGCPYERAMALMDGGVPAQREALKIFTDLGARPAAEMVRRMLHEQGVRHLPRGPRARTRENPAGLTERELEVLALMAQGLANPEIAKKLFRSAKTVEHHVSAVLAKLGATSRLEAVIRARTSGILPATPPLTK